MIESTRIRRSDRGLVWALIAGLALTPACINTVTGAGSDDPVIVVVVDDVSPHAGDYGTTITVRGSTLGRATVTGATPDGEHIPLGPVTYTPVPSTDGGAKAAKDAGTTDATGLSFRYEFPAEGEMKLTGAGGEVVSLGAFTPSWTPGQPTRLQGETVLGASALGAETAVLLAGPKGAAFVGFGAGAPRRIEIASSPAEATSASLRVSGATLEALVTTASGQVSLVTFDGTSARAASYEGMSKVLGTGVDADGFVVVVETGGNIARMRGAPPALQQVGELVAVPASVAAKKGVLAVTGDGTVVHAYAGGGGNFLDDIASFSMQALRTNEAAFSAASSLGSLDDTFRSISAESHGGIVRISYCATDTGLFSKTTYPCGSAKTVDGRKRLELDGSMPSGNGAATFSAGDLTYATCETGDSLVVRTHRADAPAGAGEPSIYPCSASKVHGIITGAGGTRLVVEADKKVWVARRR